MRGNRHGGFSRRKGCTTKCPYVSHAEAAAELERMGREWGVATWTKRIYPCPCCKCWHIGRKELRR